MIRRPHHGRGRPAATAWRCLVAPGLLVLAACGTAPPPPPAGIPARAAASGGVWLDVPAAVEHGSPAPHAPPLSWIPITALQPEGTQAATGDPLITFDTEPIRANLDTVTSDAAVEAARRAADRLTYDNWLAWIAGRRSQLEARRNALEAELRDARAGDAGARAVAALALEQAEAALAAATKRRDRLEALAAAGGSVTGQALAEARADAARAQARCAAPRLELALAEQPALQATLRRLQLSLDEINVELGSQPDEGLQAQQAAAQEWDRVKRFDTTTGDEQQRQRLEGLLADPVLHATAPGMVAYRDDQVELGAKLPAGVPCVFTLGDGGLQARAILPEPMRPFVVLGARAVLNVPGVGGEIAARIAAIGAGPESDDRVAAGRRGFACTLALAAPPPALRSGMRARGRIGVEAPGAPALLPVSCIVDPRDPWVTLVDGRRRKLTGFVLGPDFVAIAGLAPGERVLPPPGAPPSGRQRITTLIEPDRWLPVRLRSQSWQIIEVAPPGRQLAAGERIARLTKTTWWQTADEVRRRAQQAIARIGPNLAANRAQVVADRSKATVEWHRTATAAARARVEAWLARHGGDALAETRAEAARSLAAIDLDRRRHELADVRARLGAGSAAPADVRQAEVAVARAEVAAARADLDTAAARQARDWPGLMARDDAAHEAIDAESQARNAWLIAGVVAAGALSAASAEADSSLRQATRELAEVADEEVVAPEAGMLIHYRYGDGTWRVGDDVWTPEPFRIAVGTRLRATFRIPARWFGRFRPGDRIQLGILGREDVTIPALVTVVGASLELRPTISEELALGRSPGLDDRVFALTVTCEPPPELAQRLIPGSSVHVEL